MSSSVFCISSTSLQMNNATNLLKAFSLSLTLLCLNISSNLFTILSSGVKSFKSLLYNGFTPILYATESFLKSDYQATDQHMFPSKLHAFLVQYVHWHIILHFYLFWPTE